MPPTSPPPHNAPTTPETAATSSEPGASGATNAPERSNAPVVMRRLDYQAFPWKVSSLELAFDLAEDHALVTAKATYTLTDEAKSKAGDPPRLDLHGTELSLVSLQLDGKPLSAGEYQLSDTGLSLNLASLSGGDSFDLGHTFELEVVTRLLPQDNASMEGLYRSGGLFCTQMEAEGFRKVTYYPDRPDVLSIWTVSIEADAKTYPVLLSNGPRTSYEELSGGRHRAHFHDPVLKPSYLFALVAGDLDHTEERFTTMSGRDVRLCVWTDRGLAERGRHAMASLIASMRWDEQTYGREYDLDEFHIVAVADFNMGAMENKGLNLFNSNAVLADVATRTDDDFLRIEGIVAHEYFHNWSGNRVTCRDWFQLSLKEGLTVFRDQTFSEDTGSAAVQRIRDVRNLRESQFPEDAGPQSHPVRPDEYININNFYTRTIYEKGAEVIRMQRTLLGDEAYRAGTDLYFERHDGQAVTCDDFVSALEDASGVDLQDFKRWYSQAGTPLLTTRGHWDAAAGSYTLTVEQSCAPTPGQPHKLPFVIPLALGLVGPDGRDLPLQLEGEAPGAEHPTTRVLTIHEPHHEFRFCGLQGLAAAPVPSLLRGFSAPVNLATDLDAAAHAHLAAHDSDAFNRWEAFQTAATQELLRLIDLVQQGATLQVDPRFGAVFEALLQSSLDAEIDPLFTAEALCLPSERALNDRLRVSDPEAVHTARNGLLALLARDQSTRLQSLHDRHADTHSAGFDRAACGPRALKNATLAWMCTTGERAPLELALAQFAGADNMTDELAAMSLIADSDAPERAGVLAAFRSKWDSEPLVLDKWFACQAGCDRAAALDELPALLKDPAFDHGNPNKVRAVFRTLGETPVHFHRRDGAGYRLLADEIALLDSKNPILAARLSGAFDGWRHMDPERQELMRTHMQALLDLPAISPNLYELLSKSMA